MIDSVVEFLKETKISYEKFDKLVKFYDFKDKLVHLQHFGDVCEKLFILFEEEFCAKSLKITTYDIEESCERTLYLKGEDFKESLSPFVFYFDFSKSYALNGRIFFLVENEKQFEEINKNRVYLDFIFYELKSILSNYLAIEKLKESSLMDDISGLPNRRFLLKHLSSMIPIAKKEGMRVAFLKVEVDRLKAVIEEFNYEIGNLVLKSLSNTLQKHIKGTNILTKFEGDSFLICMQDVKEDNEIIELAGKCIEDFALQSVVVDHSSNQKLQKTVCIGISVYPDDGEELNCIFKNIDIALDEAKNKGRSSYEFYQLEQNSAIDLF